MYFRRVKFEILLPWSRVEGVETDAAATFLRVPRRTAMPSFVTRSEQTVLQGSSLLKFAVVDLHDDFFHVVAVGKAGTVRLRTRLPTDNPRANWLASHAFVIGVGIDSFPPWVEVGVKRLPVHDGSASRGICKASHASLPRMPERNPCGLWVGPGLRLFPPEGNLAENGPAGRNILHLLLAYEGGLLLPENFVGLYAFLPTTHQVLVAPGAGVFVVESRATRGIRVALKG
mmetsp:Transcript_131131/g.327170  ORF Transcript_131131/g.327170 Transcript_131131/m.327170 type:complete len:230 (-) Transcript_131131:815-1504(-)